jgi:uncharacterized protein YaeQ
VALKPTIYKLRIALADSDRDYYETLNLTVARHPSETMERMMARVLAFCLNAQEYLVFTKGLGAVAEPDIWVRTLDDRISLWIDVGEPAVERIKKATRLAAAVKVYTFNSKSETWWAQERAKFNELPVEVFQLPWPSIQALAALVQRTTELAVTITGGTAYVATEGGDCAVSCMELQGA